VKTDLSICNMVLIQTSIEKMLKEKFDSFLKIKNFSHNQVTFY